MSSFQGSKEIAFAHLFHFTFNHHDIIVGGANHQFHVGILKLLESGVDHELAVDACHTHFRNRAVERYVAHCNRSRRCKTGK